HAAQNQVAVVGMPLGSDRLSDWVDFQEAAEAHPDILFVVSAGNNGRNIEQRPVYPATLDISNILVVSSADDFVRPAARTNWGRLSVDFLLPAEQRPALGFDGSEVEVSGSSYAVARMVALVARIKQHNSDWRAPQLVKALQKRYTDGIAKRWVYSGYIADPLAWTSPDLSTEPLALVPEADDALDELENKTLKHTTEVLDAGLAPTLDLPLDVLVLDPAWQDPRINEIVHDAMAILAQCNVRLAALNGRRVEAPEYLRDLATGSARTLMDSLRTDAVTVVFARDTRMLEPYTGEAFGRGNTRSRPWLTDSVWLTADVRDPALALAHELTHVLTNSGEHTDQPGNLMQRRTAVGADRLETAQCIALRANALEAGLVRPSVY
ncbi:MAG: S8/S53 family peptidase, partial [Gammaproteobacteria bacterium]|nr:S8/S53 family peptidase [Gammaproteobacteria bacterium]